MSHRYCGRDFHAEEIAQIRQLIAEDPARTRAELSRLTCRRLAWYKADGGLKDMSARVAMLRMQADGFIELPPPRGPRPDPRVRLSARSDPAAPLNQVRPCTDPPDPAARAAKSPIQPLERVYPALSLARTQAAPRSAAALSRLLGRATHRLTRLWRRRLAERPAGSVHRLEPRTTPAKSLSDRQ